MVDACVESGRLTLQQGEATMQANVKFYSKGKDDECMADVQDVDRSDWLYVEDLNGDLRWIHRDRVIEIRQPYWMDVERFTLVTQLDHSSNATCLLEAGVPLRKEL
jgi:hypothetical protein